MINWYTDTTTAKAAFSAFAAADDLAIRFLEDQREFAGYCPACSNPSRFSVTSNNEASGEWRNFLEGMICGCGTNGRTRLATIAWRETRASLNPGNSLIFERVTPLFARFSEEDDGLQGCEFLGPEKQSGQTYNHGSLPVRHEDMLALSYETGSLDLLMHFDVMEHLPDHRLALKECRRVLREGGKMIFTLPFYEDLDNHIVRARLAGKKIEHLLPPAYHGNPVGDGALVFFHPGWQLLDDLREAGFKTEIGLLHNLGLGIVSNGCPFPDGHMWPVIFRATPA